MTLKYDKFSSCNSDCYSDCLTQDVKLIGNESSAPSCCSAAKEALAGLCCTMYVSCAHHKVVGEPARQVTCPPRLSVTAGRGGRGV